MILEITLFVASGLTIIGLFVHKQLEISKGIVHERVHAVRTRADLVSEKGLTHAHTFLSRITLRNLVLFINHAFVSVLRVVLFVASDITKFVHRIVEKGARRQEKLKQSGASSFYLKQIKEDRQNGAGSATDDKVGE